MKNKRTDIWVSANTTWNLSNFRAGLIRALIDAGYRVSAFAPADKYVEKMYALGVDHVHFPLNNRGTNPLQELKTILTILQTLRRNPPALLLTFTPKPNIYASLAARILGIPVVANIAGLGRAFVEGGWLTHVSRILYRLALRHPSKVFFQNPEDRDSFVRSGLVSAERAELLPGSGVDVQRFAPAVKVKRERFCFLFVGRLLADKGVREFVEAAQFLRRQAGNFECRILGFIDKGNPTAISELELNQWEADGSIRYLGAADDVRSALAGADCVVLPSYYREGCPRSLLEAASMAIPLIAANNPGSNQVLIHGKTGFVCRPRDAQDLARQMKRMKDLPEEDRARMGAAARKLILERFDERVVITRYLSTVKEALSAFG